MSKVSGMAKHSHIIGTAGHAAPRTLVGKCVPNADRQFPGNHPQVLAKSPDPTGGAVKPVNASTLNDGWGAKPRCLTCGRGQAGCICNMPDPEPEYFKPGLNRDPDWYRVEL